MSALPFNGNRWRVVTVQDGREHVSSVVLTESEALQHLEYEAALHELAGWRVTASEDMVVARRRGVERIVSLRRFTALDDAQDAI